ncbi:MAG TPA: hypothetical protein ENI23_06450 [bacterium]|nr:hypothetical protein [bacterium]
MKTELVAKIIRIFVVALSFLCLLNVLGLNTRQAQQFGLMLTIIVMFGFLLRNIWLTLFLGWTVFLYCFFKFENGSVYVANVFYGCLLYYLTKISFKKEHINFFINGILWLVVINVLYMGLQVLGLDFFFKKTVLVGAVKQFIPNTDPTGFMGHVSLMGVLMALAIPLLASKGTKISLVGSLGLFIPLYHADASLCFLMGIVGLLTVLWFRIPRKVWIVSVLFLVLMGGSYLKYVDRPTPHRVKTWRRVLQDCVLHPITGWGLDSFRNITEKKDFKYLASTYLHTGDRVIFYWDNPHNLFVSLWYEFGIVSIILLGGMLRDIILKFKKAPKTKITIGLFAFMVVFMGVSLGHFPIFLARFAVIVIPAFALLEVSMKKELRFR